MPGPARPLARLETSPNRRRKASLSANVPIEQALRSEETGEGSECPLLRRLRVAQCFLLKVCFAGQTSLERTRVVPWHLPLERPQRSYFRSMSRLSLYCRYSTWKKKVSRPPIQYLSPCLDAKCSFSRLRSMNTQTRMTMLQISPMILDIALTPKSSG